MASEFDLIVQAARKLRERDKYHSKKLPESKLTYWDADDWRLFALSKNLEPVRIKTKFGYTLEVYPEVPQKEVISTQKGVIVRVDGSHIVEFQFASEHHLIALGQTATEFQEVEVFELSFDGKQEMMDYCRKMDAIIIETAKELNKRKVASVFQKLWKEFGGSSDRLVKRVGYYRDLVSLYQSEKTRWSDEMKRVGLV
jgi:hypothetical protein